MTHVSLIVTSILSGVALGQAPAWVQLSPAAVPAGRENFAMANDLGRARTVVFGGSPGPMADTWEFDGTTWMQAMPAQAPAARSCHTMAYVPGVGRIVLFGGTSTWMDRDSLGDTWQWDGVVWTPSSTAFAPSPRMAHAMATDWRTGSVVMFGGRDALSVPQQDTWSWNGLSWTLLAGGGPPPRCCHSMAQDLATGNIVMFGGWDQGDRGDTWEFDGLAWHQAIPAGVAPLPRWGHRMTFDIAMGRLLLHGGFNGGGAETWQWNGSEWAHVVVSPGRNDFNHELAFDAASQHPMLFGGSSTLGAQAAFVTAAPATASSFGSACPGTTGIPILQTRLGSLPWIRQTLDLEITPVSSLVFTAFGLSRTTSGGAALPLALAPYGAPGCSLFVSSDAVLGIAASPTARVAMALPAVPAFVGLQFFVQGIVLDPGANALGITTSNALDLRLGW